MISANYQFSFGGGVTKDQKKALKLAIDALRESRQKYFAYSGVTDPKFNFEIRAKARWDEYTEAIRVLEDMTNVT